MSSTPDDLLDAIASAAGEVTIQQGSAETEYRRGGQLIAVCDDSGGMELRLGADVADAAMRTPDTRPSNRGADWVRLAPKTWDHHARDRLGAWFRVAWKLAAQK